MKVSHIYIKDNHQFKDFELDLTYPAGHPKAGKPLDKVCIIGQSGTGKTSLLRAIQYFTTLHIHDLTSTNDPNYTKRTFGVAPSNSASYIHSSFTFDFGGTQETLSIKSANHLFSRLLEYNDPSIVYYNNLKIKNIFIPAELNHRYQELKNHNSESLNVDIKIDFIDLSIIPLSTFWDLLNKEIKIYQETEIQKRLEISQIVQNSLTNAEDISVAVKKLEDWLHTTPSPLKNLANNCLDTILNTFNLRIKQDFVFKEKGDIGFIKIENLQGEEVPDIFLSTGTKQFILTALPLYALKPTKTIILFDEPERSLYPDIQTKIIDFYTSLSTDCQFFFATHSPLIASCFEPWEIVELKFKPDGSVYRELYYDSQKENHVDNYTIDPRYLRWDSILTRIFDLDNDSNEARTRKLMELATLRSKLHKANGKLSIEEKQKLQAQFEKLANLLDWEYDAEN